MLAPGVVALAAAARVGEVATALAAGVALAAGAAIAAGAALAPVVGAVTAGVVVGAGVVTSADVVLAAPTSGTTSGAAAVAPDAPVGAAGAPPPPLGALGGSPGHGGACVATTPADVAADAALGGGALPGHGGPPAGSTAAPPPLVAGVDGVPRIISLGLASCAHAAGASHETDTSAMVTTRSILLLYVHRRVQRDQPATPLV